MSEIKFAKIKILLHHENLFSELVVLHPQLKVTRTSLRRGFRMVSSATFFTSSQQSTRAYRLLVGLAGSMIYASFRRLKCQKRKYAINKIP